MIDQANKSQQPEGAGAENIKVPERREIPLQTQVERVEVSTEKKVEKVSEQERIVSAELRKEIEMMELDDNLKKEAEGKAQKIEFLGEKDKIEHLLQMAREKGLVFAVQVARKMNEPYLLDILHDSLAQEGFYKDFTK